MPQRVLDAIGVLLFTYTTLSSSTWSVKVQLVCQHDSVNVNKHGDPSQSDSWITNCGGCSTCGCWDTGVCAKEESSFTCYQTSASTSCITARWHSQRRSAGATSTQGGHPNCDYSDPYCWCSSFPVWASVCQANDEHCATSLGRSNTTRTTCCSPSRKALSEPGPSVTACDSWSWRWRGWRSCS